MHYKESKGILSSSNCMNIYRGCTHGCIYCDSRSKCYHIEHDFEDIEVKMNAMSLLEETLKKKRKKCMIVTGSMTDPYIHLESKLHNMRKCLEIIYKYGFGVSIQTKSDRVLEDLDILKRINEKSKCLVQMTLTTYDEELCKIIEPHVCPTRRRFEVLKVLRDNNIKTIVWLDPILPFINDTKENLMGILSYCIEAKVYGVICVGFGLTLREGNREYFYQELDKYFPGIKNKYIEIYGDNYEVVSEHNDELMHLFRKTCKENNIVYDSMELFKYMHEFDEKEMQLSLF